MAYSEGFNPHMKVAFASALSLGVTSEAEYMDFELTKPVCQPEVFDKLQKELPSGIKLKELRIVKGKTKALMAEADEARYELKVPYAGKESEAKRKIERYNSAASAVWYRVTPKKQREIETKQYMLKPVMVNKIGDELLLQMDIKITQAGSVKPIEILQVLQKDFDLQVKAEQALIKRQGLFSSGKRLIELV